jgi:hypothetical protein
MPTLSVSKCPFKADGSKSWQDGVVVSVGGNGGGVVIKNKK